MLKVLFTLDYEIHGNGEGSPDALMVEPTGRMMRLFEEYGARLTIMADVAEILKFKEYAEHSGRDDWNYEAIVGQLRDAVRRGHDVQLHIHPSYFNARPEGGRYVQDMSEYNLAGLSLERLNGIIQLCKTFLESLLKPACPEYQCIAFRAANWSVSPSQPLVRALLNNGIRIDSSVFKFGCRRGLVNFDYSSAWSDLVPWPANEKDICARDDRGKLWEFPIYAEQRRLGAFVTPHRIYRALVSRLHRIGRDGANGSPPEFTGGGNKQNLLQKLSFLTRKHAWKADFNQCSGRQLIGALVRSEKKYGHMKQDLPFILIGHSKLFTRMNEHSLRPFLAYVGREKTRFAFGTFGEFALAN